jgi:hypothetical protein
MLVGVDSWRGSRPDPLHWTQRSPGATRGNAAVARGVRHEAAGHCRVFRGAGCRRPALSASCPLEIGACAGKLLPYRHDAASQSADVRDDGVGPTALSRNADSDRTDELGSVGEEILHHPLGITVDGDGDTRCPLGLGLEREHEGAI